MRLSKEEIAEELRKKGFDVIDETGILTFKIEKEESLQFNTVKKIQKELEELGYTASWGYKFIEPWEIDKEV